MAAKAQQIGDFVYATNGDAITITGYTGLGGQVTIPSNIYNMPVTDIGDGAFEYFAGLTSVTMPNGVTNIESDAFADCPNLTSVTIPDSVTSIGYAAFYACPSLTNLTIPANVSSMVGPLFAGCSSLTNVTIWSSSLALGGGTFSSCTKLISVFFMSNAPSVNSDHTVFQGDDNATVYYLPGTTGWGAATFDGLSTKLWSTVPVITGQPQSVITNIGATVSLNVLAIGTTPLSYQWFKGTTTLSGATNLLFAITNAQPTDAGNYSVVVTNISGSTTSQVATLTLTNPPPSAATATATVVNGFIVDITISDGGFGYTNIPLVRIISSDGTGAQALAVVSNGVVVAVNIMDTGNGYATTPVVVVEPPFIPAPVMNVTVLFFGPLVPPMAQLSLANLSPYDNYQLEFSPVLGGAWTNLGAPFVPTEVTNTQFANAIGDAGFFRVEYVP